MDLPFTVEQFFSVFGSYNTAIWPVQIIAYLLGACAVALALHEDKLVGASFQDSRFILDMYRYQMIYFSYINPIKLTF